LLYVVCGPQDARRAIEQLNDPLAPAHAFADIGHLLAVAAYRKPNPKWRCH